MTPETGFKEHSCYGFIAAFFGGLMLGTHTPIVRERIQEFGEAEGQQLALFVFLIFGLTVEPAAMRYWDGPRSALSDGSATRNCLRVILADGGQ